MSMDPLDAQKGCYLIYNRKSTDDPQNQRNSLQYQRLRNLDFAKREKLPIAKFTEAGFCENGIVDESHSAFKAEDEFVMLANGAIQYRILRPKFLRAVHLLNSKKIKGLIVLCWDRASRNEQDDIILKKLMRAGCDIRFADTNYEKTSAGELHMNIDGMFAAHYSRSISEKIRNAHVKLRDEGKCIYMAPLGYLDNGSSSKPLDPERAPIIKQIFEMYATEEWSFSQLAKWARKQGLTKKPIRRRRSQEEILNNLNKTDIPRISRAVDHKTIEFILHNPFYVGKVKIAEGVYRDSAAHQPLIDMATFLKVQQVLKKRQRTIHYIDKPFFAYRGLLRCTCGRSYSPYPQKGINYYNSRCKEGCDNPQPNMRETDITKALQQIIDQIHFTDEELAELEADAKHGIEKISAIQDRELKALHERQRRLAADLAYMVQDRITLLRTGAMTPEGLKADEERTKSEMEHVEAEIVAHGASAREILDYTIHFSELVKNAGQYFQFALDSEKRELVTEVFSELVFRNKVLVTHSEKDGFGALLARKRHIGGDGGIRTF